MNTHLNNSFEKDSFVISSKSKRYIFLRENIYKALTPDEMSVYLALRYEGDYSKENSEVERNIQFISNQSKVCKRTVSECFKKLEELGLLLREYNPGYQTRYWVAQELGELLQEKVIHNSGNEEECSKNADPTGGHASGEGGVMQDMHGVMQEMHDIIINPSISKTNIYIQEDFELEKNLYFDSVQQQQAIFFRKKCLADEKAKSKHKELEAKGYDKSYEECLDECVSHYGTKMPQEIVGVQRFQGWLNRSQIIDNSKQFKTKEEREKTNQEITERERRAAEEKRKEIADSKNYSTLIAKVAEREIKPKDFLKNMLLNKGVDFYVPPKSKTQLNLA